MTCLITTHILDISTGSPASGVQVKLYRADSVEREELGSGVTDSDGRIASGLIADDQWKPGRYQLEFATGQYFQELGVSSLYPVVTIVFEVSAGQDHYHIPLLLSPFGYSTYRGS